MPDLSAALAAYALPTALSAGAFLLATLIVLYRETLKFHWMDFWYGLPLIGKLAVLSRDTSKSRKTGWLISEETLCADYRQFVNPISEREFVRCAEYLRKAGDTGRKPLSFAVMALLCLLIAAEALGFSFLLSTSMAQEGSANLHTLMTFAITGVIAVVFALIVHQAGHQLHRSGLISRAERSWRDDDRSVDLTTGDIDLKTDQAIDDDKPDYVQLVNRVGRDKSYWAVIAAVVLIVSVFVGSTYMRIQHLNSTLIQEAVGEKDSGGNPFADGKVALPDEARAPQQEALQRARLESTGAAKGEGYAAFVVLGVIFVFTQFVGVMFGMKYGFAGKHSGDAYRPTLGLGTYEEYLRVFAPRAHKAEARLRHLQQRISASAGAKQIDLNGDFEQFLSRARFGTAPASLNAAAATPVAAAAAPVLVATPQPVAATAVAAAEADQPLSLEQALLALDALPEVAQKKDYTLTLPESLRAQVVAELKARKARAAALSELDDVF